MSDDPGNAEFGVDDQALQEFADSFAGAFPAALLAPVWQAMLKAGVVVAPIRVAVDQAEVVLIDANTLELRVPVSTVSGAAGEERDRVRRRSGPPTTSSRPRWPTRPSGSPRALETADANAVFAYKPGQGQKPHN